VAFQVFLLVSAVGIGLALLLGAVGQLIDTRERVANQDRYLAELAAERSSDTNLQIEP
jgi:hypothetical protein